MSFYITSEITSDFPQELFEKDFALINMSYVIDGELYDGKVKPFLPIKEFYIRLKAGSMPQTSLVTPEQAYDFFKPVLEDNKDILHISFSSALSGSYQSYLEAAKKLKKKYPERKIIVIDSLGASLGEGMLVYYMLKHRKEGKSIDECAAIAENIKLKINHIFTVDDMFHLHRGGRVSKGAAIIGAALQIKPILKVDRGGRLKSFSKAFGKRLALREMVEIMKNTAAENNEVVFICHGNAEADANILCEKIKEKLGFANIFINDLTPIIGAHTGAGLITLFFMGKEERTD